MENVNLEEAEKLALAASDGIFVARRYVALVLSNMLMFGIFKLLALLDVHMGWFGPLMVRLSLVSSVLYAGLLVVTVAGRRRPSVNTEAFALVLFALGMLLPTLWGASFMSALGFASVCTVFKVMDLRKIRVQAANRYAI